MGKARIAVRVAKDGSAAFVGVRPGAAGDAADLDAALRAAGVTRGILADRQRQIATGLADASFQLAEVEIARGESAKPGRDARFEPAFQVGLRPGRVRNDGSMDFHDRELLKPVSANQLLGVLHPALPGSAGFTVAGKLLAPASVRETALRLGAGASMAPDGRVHATRDGVVLHVAGEFIDVVDRFVHEGPVDIHSGDLAMNGSLVVRGDVQRGFAVRATGDVAVEGAIDCGSVDAGGNLGVRGGVRGGEGGHVAVEGDVTAHHAEGIGIVCGGLLALQEAVHCQLAAGAIEVAHAIRGGRAAAERRVIADEAGSRRGIETTLAAAIPLERPVLDARRSIDLVKEQRLLARRAGGGLRGDERAKGGKLGRGALGLEQRELERKHKLAERRRALLAGAFIHVRGVAHAGVALQIGEERRTLDADARNVRFFFDAEGGRIAMESVR